MLHSITGITLDQIQLTIYTLDLINDYYEKNPLIPKTLDSTSSSLLDSTPLPTTGSLSATSTDFPTTSHMVQQTGYSSTKAEEIHDLSSSYIMLLDAIDSILLLVINELFSTRSDIIFWDHLLKGSPWELSLYQWNTTIYTHLFFFFFTKQQRMILPMTNKHDMIYHIESLKDDFNNFIILLGKLNECISLLREITRKIEGLHLFSSRNVNVSLSFHEDEFGSLKNKKKNLDGMKGRKKRKESSSQETFLEGREGLGNEIWGDPFPILEESEEQQQNDEDEEGNEGLKESILGNEDIPTLFNASPELFDQVIHLHGNPNFVEKIKIIERCTRDQIIACTQFLVESLREHIPALLAINNPSHPQHAVFNQCAGDISTENPLLMTDYEDLYHSQALAFYTSNLSTFFREFAQNNSGKDFPFEFEQTKIRRPSNFQRFWLRNVVTTIGGVYTGHVLLKMYNDGSLQNHWLRLSDWFQSKIQEHVYEPVTKLFQELFQTIRNREHIVSRKDYELSRDALHRMLSDFSQSRQGHELISKLKDQLMNNPIFQATATVVAGDIRPDASSTAASATAHSTPNDPSSLSNSNYNGWGNSNVNENEVIVTLEPTAEQALEALMKEYEQELQTPLKGVIWGNLLTAILIQMQKLKVHTEAAMLTMDQILASNELTMAATAALPALLFAGGLLMMIKSALQPKSQVLGDATKHFQLILSDVERSLEAVYDETIQVQSRATRRINAKAQQVLATSQLQTTHPTTISQQFPSTTSQNSLTSPPPLTRQQSSVSDPPAIHYFGSTIYHHFPQLWKAKGNLSFNLVRLRNKFLYIFFDVAKGNNGHTYQISASTFSSRQSVITTNHSSNNLSLKKKKKEEEEEEMKEGGGSAKKNKDPYRPKGTFNSQQLNYYQSLYELSQQLSGKYQQLQLNQMTNPVLSAVPDTTQPTEESGATLTDSVMSNQSSTKRSLVGMPRTSSNQTTTLITTIPLPFYRRSPSYYSFSLYRLIQRSNIEMLRFCYHGYYSIRHSLLSSWQSMKSLTSSIFQLFFGSNELLSTTTVYESLNKDILLLESPENEISLSRKLQITERMRRSYKMFSPVH